MAAVAVWKKGPVRSAPPPKQPRAAIVTSSGARFSLPFAPVEADHDGWADEITTLPRPGRAPAVVRVGDGLPTLAFDVLLARRSLESSVEDYLDQLRKIATSGQRLTIAGLSKFEHGPWRLQGCPFRVEARAAGSNKITRATVSLSFVAAVDPAVHIGPVTGGHREAKPNPKKKPTRSTPSTRYYRIKRGESLQELATRYYGNPAKWTTIARASKIKNPRTVPVGYRLTIPPKA